MKYNEKALSAFYRQGIFLLTTQKGLEPSTSGVTGRHSNQLSYWAGSVNGGYYTRGEQACQLF